MARLSWGGQPASRPGEVLPVALGKCLVEFVCGDTERRGDLVSEVVPHRTEQRDPTLARRQCRQPRPCGISIIANDRRARNPVGGSPRASSSSSGNTVAAKCVNVPVTAGELFREQ